MSTPNNRRRDPGGLSTEAILGLTLAITAITALGAFTASLRIGRWLAGVTEPLPSDLFDVFFGLLGGTIAWPP
ncbi:MAG: conjugal transfer protein, partial [Actinomycetes bacterium]|nr:conjugal transfer protein [Actinomycetes bacterium]